MVLLLVTLIRSTIGMSSGLAAVSRYALFSTLDCHCGRDTVDNCWLGVTHIYLFPFLISTHGTVDLINLMNGSRL
jgi:hypothetical protein